MERFLQVTGSPLNYSSARLLSAYENQHNKSSRLTANSVKMLTQFTKLNFLNVHSVQEVTSAGFETLCRSLPALTGIYLQGLTCSITGSTVPSISQLTSLTTLCLSYADLEAVVDWDILSTMTQLSCLHLIQVRRTVSLP
jgi:hypothetical protein